MAIKNKHGDKITSKIVRQEKSLTEYFNIGKCLKKNTKKIPETKMSWC